MSVRLEYVIHLFILLMSFGQYLFSCVSVSISFVVSFNYDHIQMPLNSIYKLKYVPAQLLIYGRGGKLKCIFRSNIWKSSCALAHKASLRDSKHPVTSCAVRMTSFSAHWNKFTLDFIHCMWQMKNIVEHINLRENPFNFECFAQLKKRTQNSTFQPGTAGWTIQTNTTHRKITVWMIRKRNINIAIRQHEPFREFCSFECDSTFDCNDIAGKQTKFVLHFCSKL